MFSTDLYSEVLDAAAYVTLSVFPADQTMTIMVLFQIPTWHSL
jgi:hypothetical protein